MLYLSVPSHALTFIAYVCCLHMFKCCVVCKFNMIWWPWPPRSRSTFGGDRDPRGFRISFWFYSPLRNKRDLDICLHFSYNQRPICTILSTWRNDWRRKCIHNISGQISQTPGCGLIRKSGFKSRITFGWNFGDGGGLCSLCALVVIIIIIIIIIRGQKVSRFHRRSVVWTWTWRH